MSKSAKQGIIVLILLLLLIASVVVAFLTFEEKKQLEQANENVQTQLAEQQKRGAQFQIEIQNITEQKQELDTRVAETLDQKVKLEEEVTDLNKQLGELMGRAEETREKAQQLASERDEWKNRFEEIRKERDAAIVAFEEQIKTSAAQRVIATEQPQPDQDEKISEDDIRLEGHWANVLKEKAEMGLLITDLEGELAQSSMEIEDLKKRNSTLELEISYFKNERHEIERKINRTQQMLDKISLDFVREKNDNKFFHDRLESMKQENLALHSQIKELTSLKVILEKSVLKIQSEKDNLQSKLREAEMIIYGRMEEVAEIKRDIDRRLATSLSPQEVMLPPIVVDGSATRQRPQRVQAAQPSMPVETSPAFGSIVNVNQENNFVIIDQGQSSRITTGDTFSVYRGTRYIGDIEVIQVRKDISAADIKKQTIPLQAGDTIR